jgi:hypothetical protein
VESEVTGDKAEKPVQRSANASHVLKNAKLDRLISPRLSFGVLPAARPNFPPHVLMQSRAHLSSPVTSLSTMHLRCCAPSSQSTYVTCGRPFAAVGCEHS